MVKKIKYILISGGGYAPPHKGHLNNWVSGINAYYKYIKKTDKKVTLDEILLIVIPVSSTYEKKSVASVTYKQRIDLLKLLLSHKKEKYNIIIEMFQKKKKLKTTEEIQVVQKKYNIRPALLFGADNMIDILKGVWWTNEKDLINFLTNNTFVISCSTKASNKRGYCKYIRDLFDTKLKISNISSTLILYPILSTKSEISSTRIRNNLEKYRKSGNISILTPFLFKNEIDYILKHKLWIADKK